MELPNRAAIEKSLASTLINHKAGIGKGPGVETATVTNKTPGGQLQGGRKVFICGISEFGRAASLERRYQADGHANRTCVPQDRAPLQRPCPMPRSLSRAGPQRLAPCLPCPIQSVVATPGVLTPDYTMPLFINPVLTPTDNTTPLLFKPAQCPMYLPPPAGS